MKFITQIKQIRMLAKEGIMFKHLSYKYRVPVKVIREIVFKQTWTWVK